MVRAAALAWWRARSVLVRDATLAVGLLVGTVVPATGHVAAAIGDLPVRSFDGWVVVLVGLLSVPLVLRRRYPGWCLALVGAGFIGYELAGYAPRLPTLGAYAALYAAGAYLEHHRTAVATASVAAYALLAIGLHARGSPDRPTDFALFLVALAICWGVGAGVRLRRRADATRHTRGLAAAVHAERARIARELHDIVTHHVTAMVIQADATQFLVTDAPARATDALDAISETGRRALTDLRDLLTVLRAADPVSSTDGQGPIPQRLADLVDRTRAAGQPVELIVDGIPDRASDGVELAAYRVAQESLTNALKHAPGSPTIVRIGHRPDRIDVEVTTTTPAEGSTAGPDGHGLLGLAERVSHYGGRFRAGPMPDGTFQVHASLPRAGRTA